MRNVWNRFLPSHLHERAGALLTGLVLLTAAAAVIFPLFWLLMISLKTRQDIFTLPPRWIFRPTLENYRMVFRNSAFLSYLMNSIQATAFSTTFSIVIGSLAAYSFARLKPHHSEQLMFWILSMRMLPPLAVIVPFHLMMTYTGLIDTIVGLSIVYTTFNLPIVVWLMTGYFSKVPVEIEEAALVDGCTKLEVFFRIALRLALPGLVATWILCAIFSWNEFAFALMLTGEGAKTLPVSISSWSTERGIEWGALTASGFIIILPVLVFAMIVQRQLVKGLTFGAVK
ncbi:MAG: carbohydrate ABC transporter permease [Bacillota bacterium]